MSNKGLYDFIKLGGWSSSYGSHYESAWLCFYEFDKVINLLKKEEKRIRDEGGIQEEHLEGYIHHETDYLHSEAYRSATSTHLYSCMTIEGFTNYYGTKRLGEDLFKPILERVGITEKLSLIYLVCFEKRILPSDKLVKDIRKIFDQRNSLVHPKTKEVTSQNFKDHQYVHPSELDIVDTLKILEQFIDNFCEMDKNINRAFHFNKPIKSNAHGKI